MKNNSDIPASVRSSFEKSYEQVINNRLWFDTYSDKINQWVSENVEGDECKTTTIPYHTWPTTMRYRTTTITMKPSSATMNSHNTFITLLFTIFTVLIAIRIF